MRTVKTADLAEMDNIDLSKVFAMRQVWREGRRFVMENPRPTNAVLWFCGCEGIFQTKDGGRIRAARNTVVYIPQGSRYELTFLHCDSVPHTVLAEFTLSDGEPFVLEGGIRAIGIDADDVRFYSLLEKLVFEYSLPSKPMLKFKRDMYGLLDLICEAERYRHIEKRSFRAVTAGFEYLQKDEKQELSIDEIARMCFVTPAYFRRLFKECFGISPSEYRKKRKIERAKELLEHSELSVGEVACLLGYTDPSYFHRVFSKEVGASPSAYQKSVKTRGA